MKKRIIAIVVIAAVILAAGGFTIKYFLSKAGVTSDSNKAYVTSISDIMTGGSLDSNAKLTGVVEPQKEVKVKKDDDKKIAKTYVSEGDEVNAGDKLFEYDVDDIQIQLDQAKLEVENIDQKITQLKKQLESYTDQKNKATTQDDILDATINIQQTEIDIKTQEYERIDKQNNVDKIEKSLQNTVVTSEIDGIIKSVASSSSSTSTDDTASGTSSAYITILALGNYRVKGTVSEYNRAMLSEGETVTIRSRADETQTWTATIKSISNQSDSSSSDSDSQQSMYSTNNGTSTSKYTFYAELESMDGLVLGQHVFVEQGTEGTDTKKEGVWLYSYYISYDDEGNPYVWASESDDGTLNKVTVELGEYDESGDMYEIKSGLKETDYIAFPMDVYTEGMGTTTDFSKSVSDTTTDTTDDSTDSLDEDGLVDETVTDNEVVG